MAEQQNYRAPRGVADILPDDQSLWNAVKNTAINTARQFGYQQIDTPIFENTGLFRRGVGNETDIVQKEMYSFDDLGGESLTLRPEGTAPVCRSYIEHGMHNLPQPVRLFYIAPMFRYDRPQAGRYRQHHQFGCEAIGDPSPIVDAEIIEIGLRYITALGLSDVTVRINSIGDPEPGPTTSTTSETTTPNTPTTCPKSTATASSGPRSVSSTPKSPQPKSSAPTHRNHWTISRTKRKTTGKTC